jgi:hypothetical protein
MSKRYYLLPFCFIDIENMYKNVGKMGRTHSSQYVGTNDVTSPRVVIHEMETGIHMVSST